MENSPVQNPQPTNPMQNPASDNSVQMPPSPTPNENNSSRLNLPKFNFLLVFSVLLFLGIVGATVYFMLINNQLSDVLPKPYNPELKPEQTLEEYGIVCKRYTSLNEAVRDAQIACVLDLSNQNLSTLDPRIQELKNLNSIYLSNNNFSEFPAELYGLQNLLSVDLSNNQISSIPEDLTTQIPTLQSVKLEGNNLPESEVNKYLQITPTPPADESSIEE